MRPGVNSPPGKSNPMLFTYALPRSSTTMSFHGFVETSARSAWVTRVPVLPGSVSRRIRRWSAEETTSSRPSGRNSMHMGKDASCTSTAGAPPGETE